MPYLDKKKQRACQAKYLKSVREAWLAEHGPCWWCGSSFKLEVDHIDPAEKTSHRIWSWSKERRDAELAKCQVLCWGCHRLKHRATYRRNYEHGTLYCYRRLECRCQPCKDANTRRVYEQRDRRLAKMAASPTLDHTVTPSPLGGEAA